MKAFIVFFVLFTSGVYATEILSDKPSSACEEVKNTRGVKFFKDPNLFLVNLSLMYVDPQLGWETLMNENPLITTFKGDIWIQRLGEQREFKNFGVVAKLYEAADSRFKLLDTDPKKKTKNVMIVPVKLCGPQEGYNDMPGFMLVADLENSQKRLENGEERLPPSTRGNKIPELPVNLKE
jgi:hypothetical protein